MSEQFVQKKALNILFVHAYWNNRGDEAAIRAMIDTLKLKIPIQNMEIMIESDDIVDFPYDDVKIIDVFPPLERSFISNLFCFSADIILSLSACGRLALTNKGKKFIAAVDRADVIIHAPGGPSIGNLYQGRSGIKEIFYLYRLLIPTLKNKSLFFYAPSMGPFSAPGESRKIMNIIRKFVLRRANAIIVREEISSNYLKEQLGLDSYVVLDSAFQNEIPDDYLDKYTNISDILDVIKNNKVVGITITDLIWHPIYKNNIELRERILRSFSEVTKYLTDKGYIVILIPHLFGEISRIERPFLVNIRDQNPNKILILPIEIDSYAQQAIISKLFCVIGMRYHSGLFSTKACIPFIPVSYEHKIDGFIKKIDYPNLLIKVENINSSNIINKFEYLVEHYDTIKEQLKNKKPQLKLESEKTNDIILNKLVEKGLIFSTPK